MKNILKKTFVPLIIVGTILTAVWLFQGVEDWSVITKQSINYGSYTWEFYSFDIRRYLINLQNSLKPEYLLMAFGDYPQIPPTPDWTNVVSILKFLANCFIWVPNLFIFIINYSILGVTKLLIYPLNILVTLLGLNNANIDYINVIKNIMNFNISYINYV